MSQRYHIRTVHIQNPPDNALAERYAQYMNHKKHYSIPDASGSATKTKHITNNKRNSNCWMFIKTKLFSRTGFFVLLLLATCAVILQWIYLYKTNGSLNNWTFQIVEENGQTILQTGVPLQPYSANYTTLKNQLPTQQKQLIARFGGVELPRILAPSSIDEDILNSNADVCKGALYEFACGGYNMTVGRVYEATEIRNREAVHFLENIIKTKDSAYCLDFHCHGMLEFYDACLKGTSELAKRKVAKGKQYTLFTQTTEFGFTERKSSVMLSMFRKLNDKKYAKATVHRKIAMLLMSGIITPLSIKRNHHTKHYHLRYSGIVPSENYVVETKRALPHEVSNKFDVQQVSKLFKRLRSFMQVEQGDTRKQKSFVEYKLLTQWDNDWKHFFDELEQHQRDNFEVYGNGDANAADIYTDDSEFLNKMGAFFDLFDETAWEHTLLVYVYYTYESLMIQDEYLPNTEKQQEYCIDLVKHFYPMTLCTLFTHLEHVADESVDDHAEAEHYVQAHKIKNHLIEVLVERFGNVTFDMHFGGCAALFEDEQSAESVFQVEQTPLLLSADSNSDIVEIISKHFLNNTQWNMNYHPLELHYSFPPMLEGMDDPLHWFAQVDAWFDPYHNRIVMPPGILRMPIYLPIYSKSSSYAMLGFITAHEMIHSIQERFDTECVVNEHKVSDPSGAYNRRFENLADAVGMELAYEALLRDKGTTEPVCAFFVAYAQLWCDNRSGGNYVDREDPHAPPRLRVNHTLRLTSRRTREHYVQCFDCDFKTAKYLLEQVTCEVALKRT